MPIKYPALCIEKHVFPLLKSAPKQQAKTLANIESFDSRERMAATFTIQY